MKLERFYIVEARHPNIQIMKELRVFTNKKEAFNRARRLAEETFYEIDVISQDGLIARANYDDLPTDGKLFKEKDC
jgi:hypothetical protein